MLLYQITYSQGLAPLLRAYTRDPAGANLPSNLPNFASLYWANYPKVQVNIDRGQPVPGLNVDDCLRDIERNGFHIVPVRVQAAKDVLAKAMLLYKVLFDKTAREVGGIVSFNSQHSALWANGGFSEERYEGVCYGLAAEWLKERAVNRGDLLANLAEFRNRSFVSHQPGMDSFVKAVTDSQVAQGNGMAMVLGGVLKKVSSGTSTYPFADLSKLFPTRRFFYISTKGHAMAAYCSWKGQVAFYDPNVGLVTDTDRQFFGKYLEQVVYGTYELTDEPKHNPLGKIVTVEVYKKP